MGPKEMRIYYQNVRGLRTKQEEFFVSIADCTFDVVAVTETAFNDKSLMSEYFPSGWNVFRSDRDFDSTSKTRGGGSLLAIRKGIQCCRRGDLELAAECVWVEMKLKDGRLLLGNHYFSPDTHPDKISSYFKSLSEVVSNVSCRIVMVGDFNIPNVDWKSAIVHPSAPFYVQRKASMIFDFMDDLNLYQYNDFVPKAGKSILDLVLSNFEVNVELEDDVVVKADAPHDPLVVTIGSEEVVTDCVIEGLDYRKGDYYGLYQAVKYADWTTVYEAESVDEAANGFSDILGQMLEMYIPRKRPRVSKYPNWFSADLIRCLKNKKAAHKKYKRNNSVDNYAVFAELRKEAKFLLSRDLRRRASRIEDEVRAKPANLFKYVNSYLKESKCVRPITTERGIVTDAREISIEFGNFFHSVYQLEASDTQVEDFSPQGDVEIPQVNVEDVVKAISELRPQAAAGYDNVPPYIFKGLCELIAPVLAHIYNISLQSGIFPGRWKLAIVSPVPKKGDLHSVRNYRPVSVLCIASKIFEKVVHRYLYGVLKGKIDSRQHGFMQKRSTVSNLNHLLSFMAPAVKNRMQVDTIYFDFRKAFDSVPHSILVQKLAKYGIAGRMLRWIRSYLSGRKFKVKVANELSDEYDVTSGVPQGSNLGPLLFILFVNDITRKIKTNILMFADDIKVYGKANNIAESKLLQEDIDWVNEWSIVNKMPLNLDKTVVVTYSRKTMAVHYGYNIAGDRIRRESSIRDLGVLFDSKLLFNGHVDNIVSKARRNLGLLLWVARRFNTADTILRLYKAIVRPILEYCSTIWNYNRDYTNNKVEAVQKRLVSALRYRGMHNGGPSYKDDCQELNILTLQERRAVYDVMFAYKALNGYVDIDISKIGIRVPSMIVRRRDLLIYEDTGQLSPLERCVRAVNELCKRNELDIFGSSLHEFKKIIIEGMRNQN